MHHRAATRAAAPPPDMRDPLAADDVMIRLPGVNRKRDTATLIAMLERLTPTPERAAALNRGDALAAMRDLGMLAGSVRRLGLEPVDVVPRLEPTLLALGVRGGTIPRDTVHHYTEWNPRGGRERLYTGSDQERALIDAVRDGLRQLELVVDALRTTTGLEPAELAFALALEDAADGLDLLVTTMDRVRGTVDPVFFAQELRPFFDPITVGGRVYLGPAAAHMPVWIVDFALWAADQPAAVYHDFVDESRAHTLTRWHRVARRIEAAPPVATRVVGALRAAGADPPPGALARSAEALERCLHALVRFRGKHLSLARRAYREEVTSYETGSGGGTLQMLTQITALTRAQERRVAVHAQGPPCASSSPAAE